MKIGSARLSPRLRTLLLGLVVFCLIFFRYCYFGFEYYYQLDDYIQLHNYAAFNPDLGALIEKLGLLSSRPLAGLADIYVWTRFFDGMLWAVALISAMYAASAMLMHSVFRRRFGTGTLFLVVYALLPINFEGAYWVSASNRIIVGLFLASLGFYFFDGWCRRGGLWRLLAYAAAQFASFCFYEQVVMVSGALTLIIMLLCLEEKQKRGFWGFLMFAGAGLYFLLTSMATQGFSSERVAWYLPWEEGWGQNLALPLTGQVLSAFLGGFRGTCCKGLVRGSKMLFTEPNLLWLLFTLLLCAALFVLLRDMPRRREEKGKNPGEPRNPRTGWELLSGLLLFAAPVALFYVLRDPWFSLRAVLPSLCGLGLMADAVFDLIFRRVKSRRIVQPAIVCALALICTVASVSETKDYMDVRRADAEIAQAVADTLVSRDARGENWVLNVNPTYLSQGNFYFHEHDYGVTSSSWAFTGAVNYYAGSPDYGASPIPWNASIPAGLDAAGNASLYLYDNGACIPLTREKLDDYTWRVLLPEGGQLTVMRWQDSVVYFDDGSGKGEYSGLGGE